MKKQTIFDKHIPSWLIVDAFRYALGRSSYQVQITCEWLDLNWDYFDENTKAVIFRDLKEEIRRHVENPDLGNLGMKQDVKWWYWLFSRIEPKI